ncbi:hypothetical protein [Naasia aerilata]|uniref:Uncharacterized protein n=1 Tax=Naasia aerilata TaxID=1162966 RepID=A0ABN6XQT8_9MICO|nr:hypothetical protein [Naasia aerilata]BDZ45960.1 hypothetical protein GCM10025866_18690 [Naasia aerilata]
MSGSPASVLGFAVIFLVVGAFGGYQLGWLASLIFLVASGALFAFSAVTLVLHLRRRALAADQAPADAEPKAVASV